MSLDSTQERHIFERLRDCDLVRGYKQAFEAATGLPLMIAFAGEGFESHPCQGAENVNPFCRLLNQDDHVCEACLEMTQRLEFDAEKSVRSANCFAGLNETAVPVRMGDRTLAFLKTGEVFEEEPTEEGFAAVEEVLVAEGRPRREIAALRTAYFESPVVDGARYEGMVALLATFARQLSDHVDELVLATTGAEPVAVRRAKKFIEENLDEPLTLGAIATEVGVSEYYFCKIFKQSTGLTFTEYVNRKRIDWAKRELRRPDARVTEVAFHVGYQSLSQFNRSFARIVGVAPSQFRQQVRDRSQRPQRSAESA